MYYNNYHIIIPYHSNFSTLATCVNSLLLTTPKEIDIMILANNKDDKELNISFESSRVKIVKVNKNLYYPKAVNMAISLSEKEHIILSDSDTIYYGDWFINLVNCYKSSSNIGIVGSRIIYTNDGRIRDFGMGFNGYNFPHPFRNRKRDHPLVSNNRQFLAVCTCSCILNKSKFLDVGGFEEDLEYSYSDIDLCLKFREKGYEVWGCAKSDVYHQGKTVVTNIQHYSSETKARLIYLNARRLPIDFSYAFIESANYFLENQTIEKQFVLLDLTSICNKAWHYNLFIENLNIKLLDIINFEQTNRDMKHIDLYRNISYPIYNYNTPLIYFVDDYTSIKNNELWFKLRNYKDDIVIDRHGNIEKVLNILNEGV